MARRLQADGRTIDPDTSQQITGSERLVFHSVGGTGGVAMPTYVDSASHLMECDMTTMNPRRRPLFVYHLGDVVYWDQVLAACGGAAGPGPSLDKLVISRV